MSLSGQLNDRERARFRSQLRSFMQDNAYNQGDVAKRLGLSQSHVSRLLRTGCTTYAAVRRLAENLNVDLYEILDRPKETSAGQAATRQVSSLELAKAMGFGSGFDPSFVAEWHPSDADDRTPDELWQQLKEDHSRHQWRSASLSKNKSKPARETDKSGPFSMVAPKRKRA